MTKKSTSKSLALSGNHSRGFEKNFVWKISICSSVAYLMATVPQVFIDPLLEHHVRFHSRTYPHAFYYIIPLCIATCSLTVYLMNKSRRILLSVLPFIGGALASIPIFRPEIPHGNLMSISIIWLVIMVVTLWIHEREIDKDVIANLESSTLGDKTAKIEYLKEEVQYWRTIIIGIAGGYIAILISWVDFIVKIGKENVGGNEGEAFILSLMSGVGIGLCSVGIMIGPLAEANKRHHQASRLFLRITGKVE